MLIHKLQCTWIENTQSEAPKCVYLASSAVDGRGREALGLAGAADELFNDLL